MYQRVDSAELLFRLRARLADDRQHTGHDEDFSRHAPETPGAGFYVCVKGAGVIEILLYRENHFGGFGGKIPALVGLSGLHDYRAALGRPQDR